MKGKPRSRIVTVLEVPAKPRVMKKDVKGADGSTFDIFAWGIKIGEIDGAINYANVQATGDILDEVKIEKMRKSLLVDGEMIEVGQTYELFEEATDNAERYWRVVAFNDNTKLELDPEIEKNVQKELGQTSGVPTGESCKDGVCEVPSPKKPLDAANGARSGMLFNNAVQIAITEKKDITDIIADIEVNYRALRALLNKLEGKR